MSRSFIGAAGRQEVQGSYRDWNRIGGSLLGFWLGLHLVALLGAGVFGVPLMVLCAVLGALPLPALVGRFAVVVVIALTLAEIVLVMAGLLGLFPWAGLLVAAAFVIGVTLALVTRVPVAVHVRVGNRGVTHRS